MFLFFVNLLSHQHTTYCQWATSPPSRLYDVPLASLVSSPKDEGAAWAQEKLQKSESDWQIMVTQTAGKENAGSWWVVFLSVFVGTGCWGVVLATDTRKLTFQRNWSLSFMSQHSPLKCHLITGIKQLNAAVVKKNLWIQTNDAGALGCIDVSQALHLAMDQRTYVCDWMPRWRISLAVTRPSTTRKCTWNLGSHTSVVL